MILYLMKNEFLVDALVQGLKKDQSAPKPGDTEQVKPDVLERHDKTNDQDDPREDKEKYRLQ